ncbi:tRNA lysidine(34) synthetase TilS [Dongia sp.]|uniref:tRNA lysidine(34) synthetase TilS n=1 Tax=Dongia sp. TaxID=1977262 RepID=UPI0035B34078
MAALGPFESSPEMAVAVSGGRDSVALMRLLAQWCRDRQGRLTALTVDHGLRPDSAREADQVALWARELGIAHVTLCWTGLKPRSRVQEVARQARYDLLTAWCRAAGVLHLALAHQADDQRETVAMRRARDPAEMNVASPGLAGMSAVTTRSGVRLVRPLLGVTREALSGFLRDIEQDWLEDPSNRAEKFERVRWRLGRLGRLPDLSEISAAGELRRVTEAGGADLLMRAAEIASAGYALLDLAVLMAASEEIRDLAVGQLIATIGGGAYRPARSALRRDISTVLSGGPVRSLGGCLVGNWRGRVLVAREAAAAREIVRIAGPGEYFWDRRFAVRVGDLQGGSDIAVLGEDGLREIAGIPESAPKLKEVPPLARPGLPAFRDATGRLIRVPFTGFDPFGLKDVLRVRLLPYNSATSGGFTVA